MNPLDWVLLLTAALAVLVGWRTGLVCGLMSLFAVVIGGAAGFLLGRAFLPLGGWPQQQQSLALMACMVVGIIVAQISATGPVQRVHEAVIATPLRRLNSAGGAMLTLGFGVVITWMLATALALAPSTSIAGLMRGSVVLVGLDRTVPMDAGQLFNQLEARTGLQPQPRVFTGLGLLPVPAVEAPAEDQVSSDALTAAQESVVRIMGHAECGSTFAGSGVVVGDGLVVTNAHVIAGVDQPIVFAKESRFGSVAVPVHFDPVRDIALLRVRDLDAPAVRMAGSPTEGQTVAVAGYPNAGQLQVKAAGVRGLVTATGSDIYGEGQSQRQVLVVAGNVIPGDSGGALLSSDGAMVGLVFAASEGMGGHTGYALSAEETQAVVGSVPAHSRVSTGDCVPGA